ncbi:Mur ligase [Clostridia bacterium]|nr:Mur ligase [Clostridia bacterium]
MNDTLDLLIMLATGLSCTSAFVFLFLRHLHIFQLEGYHKISFLKWVVLRELASVKISLGLLLFIALQFIAVDVRTADLKDYAENTVSVSSPQDAPSPQDTVSPQDDTLPLGTRRYVQDIPKQLHFLEINAVLLKIFTIVLLVTVAVLCSLHRNTKKPLVFTNRVKRLCVTYGLLIAAYLILILNSGIAYITATTVPLAVVLGIPLADIVISPFEAANRAKYVRQARGLLRDWNGVPIGITGSFGKTSVKFYLGELLQIRYNTLVTPRSFNTPMGIVKTIREELRPLTEYFVCEMGAVRTREISELCDIVKPKYGIITSVGNQHLETFGSVENIVNTKFELAESVAQNGGTVFINTDSERIAERYFREIENRKPARWAKSAVTYGFAKEAQYRAFGVSVSAEGTRFSIAFPNGEVKAYTTSLIGEHNVVNITGAVAAAHTLGVTEDETVFGVRKIKPVPHRMEVIRHTDVTVIDDGFNSNPSGARAALDTLSLLGGEDSDTVTRVFISPGMVELGEDEANENRRLGKYAADKCDYAVLIGERRADSLRLGLIDGGFQKNRIAVVANLNAALAFAKSLPKKQVILIENDLPDNY